MDQHIGYNAYPGKTKAIGKYPAFWVAAKRRVLEREKHNVGYAMGSHVTIHQHSKHKNKLLRGQVSCQAAATKNGSQIRSGEATAKYFSLTRQAYDVNACLKKI